MSDSEPPHENAEAVQRRLALFLDGTWNQVSDNTNIWRMRTLIAPQSSDGYLQLAYYSTGLGTKFGEKISGGMFGAGIDTAITSAYEWLVDNYQPNDEIFIFGFSRGAYTARSLSGFISKCGLLKRGAPLGVNQLYKRYRLKDAKTIRTLIAEQQASSKPVANFEENWMLEYAQAVPIKFIGVFDTVGSLGVPFKIFRRIRGSAYPFLNTGLRQNNEFAYHAMAIDEHRKDFRPTLWTNTGATNASIRPLERTEQRWFTGAHANIGGGCFSDPLAQLPLKWLASKAAAHGLKFSYDFPIDAAVTRASVSDSFSEFAYGLYRLIRLGIRYYRPIGIPSPEEGAGVQNINETIDSSVFERWRSDAQYRPPALAAWAKRNNTDPSKLTQSVRADQSMTVVSD